MANAYFYSNTAVQTTLGGNISNSATSFTVASTTGFPASVPFVLAIDYGAATEELVLVTAPPAGTTLTVTRGFSGTSAQSHSIGAVVRHVVNAQDLTDFRTHEASTGAVHGLTGSIVGTSDSQTLGNKTLTSPTINAGALSGTFTGNPTLSGNPAFSGTPNFTGTIQSTQSAATNVTLGAIVTADTFDRFRLQAGGRMEWGPGNAARDAIAYRDAVGVLGTVDTAWRVYRTAAASLAYAALQTGDANPRWYTEATGKHWWGNGTAAVDTNLYRSGAGALTTDGSFAVGGSFTATGVGGQLHARKTGDTTVTNSTVVTQDPHLVVTVPANSIWEMVGCIFYASGVITGDLNYQFTGPAGSSGFHTAVGPSTVVNTDPPNEAVGASQSGNRTIATAIGSGRSYGVPNTGNVFGLEMKGMFEIAGTSGTISVDWAQQTAQTTGTTLKIYSWFSLTRVA
ncbi:hypothetical protein [Streptomyces sp. NPDC010273]|uniref:hypothetical protein n=1 Tax=Streptomyces sp. NPDC010273 TaxID=3364829 RepID=UPI0036E15A51